jgi:hypothetical protein
MSLDEISLVTYSNSNCADIWPMYLGQLEAHAPLITNNMFLNMFRLGKPNSQHKFYLYTQKDPYYKQWTKCLKHVKTDYIIYMQEDFILYDDIDIEALLSYQDFLDNSNYSFVRLIRANFDENLCHIKDDLYDVNCENEDIFAMQATLWKKSDIENLYLTAKSEKWLEGLHWRDSARKLGIKGAYCYRGEARRGRYHCDSSVFPYVCTAINRGLWNINEYSDIMPTLLEKYDVDPWIRGMRGDYTYENQRNQRKQ